MNETEAIGFMVAPGTRRPGKYRDGVIQIHVTRACDKSCFGCTQGSQLRGKLEFISLHHFEQAVISLKGYFGVVGVFGGNPALHPQFIDLCKILCEHIPYEQRGLWCNNPVTVEKARCMANTFNPNVSNLNVHLDLQAYKMFKKGWPQSIVVGLYKDSRHSPPFVAIKDVIQDEEKRWELISDCDINKHWSAMIGVFRGQLRAWFCEVAGSQSILHQDEPDYPDTGMPVDPSQTGVIVYDGQLYDYWWQLPMTAFAHEVRKHCHECGVPLRGYGELAQTSDEHATEQTSATHQSVFLPKRTGRAVELVTVESQLSRGQILKMTDYLGNARL
jgi:hypothetical protein